MKIRNRLLLRLFGRLAAVVIRLWHLTLRHPKMAVDGTDQPSDANQQRCIYAVWHDSILTLLYVKTRIDVLISHHSDGELITQACRMLGFGVVRGSSTRGGAPALMEMIERSRDRHLLVTPDGPRGPRHVVRPGLVYLASLTRLPIRLIAVGYSRAWRLNSWDCTAVPKPFSTVYGIVSEPIEIPAALDRDDLTEYCGRIEERFIQLTASAERWALTGRCPSRAELQPLADTIALRSSA